MATLEQLQSALVNADKAGDTEAATALATEIKRVSGGLTDQQQTARTLSGAAGFGGYAPDILMGLRQPLDAAAEGLSYLFGDRKRAQDVNQSALDNYKQTFGSLPGSDAVRGLARGAVSAAALPMQAPGVIGAAALGGGQGALASLASPAYGVSDADYAGVKGKQATQGLLSGALLGGGLGLAGKVLGPSEAAQALKSEGITPTIGQTMGGAAKPLEEKLSSVPIAGDIIKMGQASGLKDFNRAIYNRILAPLGQKYEGPVGQEGLGEVSRRLSQAYEDTLGKMGPTVIDDQFRAGVNQLDSMLAGAPGAQEAFRNVLRANVASKVTPTGTLPPSALKDAESALGQFVRNYKGAPGDGMMAAQAVEQLQAGLRQMAQRSNPEQAPVLQAVNKGYAELVQLQNAANSVKVARNEGIVTPVDYLKGIKQGDKSARDHVFSSGEAMNQDLAQAADKVLSSTYPDSGSIGRGLAAALAMGGGGAMIHPAMALGALYLPGMRQLAYGASGLLGKAANAVPYLAGPAVAGLLGQ